MLFFGLHLTDFRLELIDQNLLLVQLLLELLHSFELIDGNVCGLPFFGDLRFMRHLRFLLLFLL